MNTSHRATGNSIKANAKKFGIALDCIAAMGSCTPEGEPAFAARSAEADNVKIAVTASGFGYLSCA